MLDIFRHTVQYRALIIFGWMPFYGEFSTPVLIQICERYLIFLPTFSQTCFNSYLNIQKSETQGDSIVRCRHFFLCSDHVCKYKNPSYLPFSKCFNSFSRSVIIKFKLPKQHKGVDGFYIRTANTRLMYGSPQINSIITN